MAKILPIIVIYNQQLEDSKTFKTLLSQNSFTYLYVYDNSPIAQNSDSDFAENIIYNHNHKNPGLSYAYNRGAEYAKKNGYEWILLLDQDTSFPNGIISDYENAIRKNPAIKLFVPTMKVQYGKYMSPVRVKHRVSRIADSVPSGLASLWDYSPINSGMMINVNAFLEVGGYNEKVRLDFSDFQFIERLRKIHSKFYVIDSICYQEFSNEVQNTKQLLGRYKIFCECLKNCDRENMRDYLDYFWVVAKRGISLTIRTRKLIFIYIFIKHYL